MQKFRAMSWKHGLKSGFSGKVYRKWIFVSFDIEDFLLPERFVLPNSLPGIKKSAGNLPAFIPFLREEPLISVKIAKKCRGGFPFFKYCLYI